MLDAIHYYSPETTLFPDLASRFAEAGHLSAEELYIILDWKASRARTRHLKRLTVDRTFAQAAEELGRGLRDAEDDCSRLKLMVTPPWSFALPTATAVLVVLYPDRFTVYDIRVCNELGHFHALGGKRWSDSTWHEYCHFMAEVRGAAPKGMDLRNADRWLWGKNKQQKLIRELGLQSSA